MEYTKLGRTGLDVSRVCLGCMSYGVGNLGNHTWSLPEEESRPFIKKALEAGCGKALSGLARRRCCLPRRDVWVRVRFLWARQIPGRAPSPPRLVNRGTLVGDHRVL